MCVHACVGEWSFFAVVVSGYRRVPRRILHPKHDMTMEWKECYHKCTCSSAAKYRRAYGTSNAKSCTVSNWSDAEPTDLGTDFGSICVTVAAAMSSSSLSLAAMMAFPLFSDIFRGSVANRLMIFGTNTHLNTKCVITDFLFLTTTTIQLLICLHGSFSHFTNGVRISISRNGSNLSNHLLPG